MGKKSRVIVEKHRIRFHVEEKKLLDLPSARNCVKLLLIVIIREVTSNTIVTLVPVQSARSHVAKPYHVATFAAPFATKTSKPKWRRMAKLLCHGRSEDHNL